MKESQYCALVSDADWQEAYPLLAELRPDLERDAFRAARSELLEAGYVLRGRRVNNTVVAVAGFSLIPHVTWGLQAWIHDFVVARSARRMSHGRTLLEDVFRECRAQGAGRVCLNTRKSNEAARAFYRSAGAMDEYGVVFKHVF